MESVRISDELKHYIVDLVAATRTAPSVQASVRQPARLDRADEDGAGGGVVRRAGFVTPEQIQKLAVSVIAHRLVLEPQARFSGVTQRGVVEEALKKLKKCRREVHLQTDLLELPRGGWDVVLGAPAVHVHGDGGRSGVVRHGCGGRWISAIYRHLSGVCIFWWHWWRSLSRAAFSSGQNFPPRDYLLRAGTAGQPLVYKVLVRNLTTKNQAGLAACWKTWPIRARRSGNGWRGGAEDRRLRAFRVSKRKKRHPFRLAESKQAEIPVMPARGEAEVRAEIFPLRRGILKFHGVSIARPDPFGLYRAFVKVPSAHQVLILPKRYPLPPIALPGAMRYQEGGVALAANVGRSEEFVSSAAITRHGDPLRHIHWRSWAKTDKPIVKEFEDEFFVRHALVLDTFDEEPNSEVLEEAVSVAASFACTILTQESLLDLLFVGNQSYCFTSGRGLAHADQMLEILASVKNCADKPFAALEHLVLNHISVVSGCICVLQRWDEPRQKFVEKLKALNVPMLVLIVVPAGGKISGNGHLLNGAEVALHVLEVGKIEEGLRKL